MARKSKIAGGQAEKPATEPADEVLDGAKAFAEVAPMIVEDETPVGDDGESELGARADDLRPEIELMGRYGIVGRAADQSLASWFRLHVERLDALRAAEGLDYALLSRRLLIAANVTTGDGEALDAHRVKQLSSDSRREIEVERNAAERRARNAEREAASIRLVVSRDLEPALALIAPDLSPSAAATLAIERTAALVDKERRETPSDEVVARLGELIEGETATRAAVEECAASVKALIDEMQRPAEGPHPLESKIDELAKTIANVMSAFTVRLEQVETQTRAAMNISARIEEALGGLTAAVNTANEG